MMRKIIIKILVLSFVFCKSNLNIYAQNNCFKDTTFFSVSKTEMIFDVINFHKNYTKGEDLILIDNTNMNSTAYELSGKNIANRQINKVLQVEKWITYFPNGKIHNLSFHHNSSGLANLYKEFTYNENGIITEIIDHERDYNICWQEAIEICKKLIGKRKLKKYNIKEFSLRRPDISDFPDAKPLWIIMPIAKKEDGTDYKSAVVNEYYKANKGDISYHIDGVTGKLIRKTITRTMQ